SPHTLNIRARFILCGAGGGKIACGWSVMARSLRGYTSGPPGKTTTIIAPRREGVQTGFLLDLRRLLCEE
ncbi:MAG: hypothetical protein AMK72_04150, partial [Planctomycetes bacterium SM23_25]